MLFPTTMALAVFDALETSYLSVISIQKYFHELRVGNFPEGQSIREQSSSILRGHTVWDAFEYRLVQVFRGVDDSDRLARLLAKMVSDLAANYAELSHDGVIQFDECTCRSILLEAWCAELGLSQGVRLLEPHTNFHRVAREVFSIWEDLTLRLYRIAMKHEPQNMAIGLENLTYLEEEYAVQLSFLH